MPINDDNANTERRHKWSRNLSPPQSSPQAQATSVTQSGGAENAPSALFESATSTSISGGQFTAAANVNRNVTINISEGVTPQIGNESCHSRQTANRRRNRRKGPMRPQQESPTGPGQRSNEIYERHLRLKERGHPLWIPQPNMALPIPYRTQGTRVGDVGLFTDDGMFDYLFNVCVPRDDPINPEELPENFVPISPSINPVDIRKFVEFSPDSYLASSSVIKSQTAEHSSGLTFESSASEGAILTMPEGAYSENLSNFSRLREYIGTHAEEWYRFINGPRGREAQNGDLRVVTGYDKTTSWGMATFANSSLSQDTNFRLKFSALEEQPSRRGVGNKYTWEYSGLAEVRVGPGRGENEELGETDSNRLRNQSLFLRTLRVELSEKVWREVFPHTVVVADQNNSDSGIQDPSIPSPRGSSTGHSQSSQSNSSQTLPFRNRNSFAAEEGTNSQTPPNNSPDSGSHEETRSHSTVTPDDVLKCNSALHPSKIISKYLLEQAPGARVAVTHDKDWSSVIGMDSCHSDSSLLSIVCSMNDIVLDNDTGVVSLELKERDQDGISSEEEKVARLVKSIKDGRLTLVEYLFGSKGDPCQRLRGLCDALRSDSTDWPIPKLTGHPERPLSLDNLFKICEGDHAQDSLQRQSISSLRAELTAQPASRSTCLLHLADALIRRFSQWAQRDDLEEAIWSYEEALSVTPNSHYQYLEVLLGLCTSLCQRFYLLRHTDDLNNLLKYLELQCGVLSCWDSRLAPLETQLKKLHSDSRCNEERLASGPHAQAIEVYHSKGTDAATVKQSFEFVPFTAGFEDMSFEASPLLPELMYPELDLNDHHSYGSSSYGSSSYGSSSYGSSSYGLANDAMSNANFFMNDYLVNYKNSPLSYSMHPGTPSSLPELSPSSSVPSISSLFGTPTTPGITALSFMPSPVLNEGDLAPQQDYNLDPDRRPLFTHRQQMCMFREALTLPCEGAGPFVPQLMYKPHTISDRRRYVEDVGLGAPIYFVVDSHSNQCGISLQDALRTPVKHLVNCEQLVFEGHGPSVAIRLEWPGYRPWSRQIPTRDFRSPPGPITIAKLARNVARCIQRFIQDRKSQRMEDGSDHRWRIGDSSDDIKFDDLMLVSIHHVSLGSWQPHLRLRRPQSNILVRSSPTGSSMVDLGREAQGTMDNSP